MRQQDEHDRWPRWANGIAWSGVLLVILFARCADKAPHDAADSKAKDKPSSPSIKTSELNGGENQRASVDSTFVDSEFVDSAIVDSASKSDLKSASSMKHQDSNTDAPEPMLSELLKQSRSDDTFIPKPINEEQVQALGIRKIEGRYIDLYTDVRDDDLEDYVRAFDLAVPQWAAYFEVDVPEPEDFHVRGSLIQNKDRFQTAKLLPADIPPFPHGYQDRAELWVYPQPGDYFTRHLLLHEGTHAFMRRVLDGSGPPWYMEGIAELLATHQWLDGKLQLGYSIRSSEEAPYWGRVKIVRDAFQEGQAMSLEAIMQYGWRAHLELEPYGWCWAACEFFDGHPRYRPTFRQLRKHVSDRTITFSQQFIDALPGNWNQVTEQWQLFSAEMDYGYDQERTAIEYRPTKVVVSAEAVAIQADRGWQSTGLSLEAGRTYQLQARGDVTLADDPKPWRSEANGITFHYYRGKPLGILLGAIRDENSRLEGLTPLATPFVIGQDLELRPDISGTLFVRINDSPADLANNRGEFQLTITPTRR